MADKCYCNMCGIQISSPGICNDCQQLLKDLEKEKKKLWPG